MEKDRNRHFTGENTQRACEHVKGCSAPLGKLVLEPHGIAPVRVADLTRAHEEGAALGKGPQSEESVFLANSPRGLSPASHPCEQPAREPGSGRRARHWPPPRPARDHSLLTHRSPTKSCPDSRPANCEIINVCCLKPLEKGTKD